MTELFSLPQIVAARYQAGHEQSRETCSASRPRPFSNVLNEVIPWITKAIADGTL